MTEVPLSTAARLLERRGDKHVTRQIPTGELRSALQPVVFLHMLEPVSTVDGSTAFAEGDLVAAQFWGSGLVALTSTLGVRAVAIASDIKAAWLTPGHDAPSE